MIQVTDLGELLYEVTVSVGGVTTVHRVTLSDAERQRLAGEPVSATKLIEESFRFLLERESSSSILSRFELGVIGRYFPDYEAEIRRRLGTD